MTHYHPCNYFRWKSYNFDNANMTLVCLTSIARRNNNATLTNGMFYTESGKTTVQYCNVSICFATTLKDSIFTVNSVVLVKFAMLKSPPSSMLCECEMKHRNTIAAMLNPLYSVVVLQLTRLT